MSLSNEQAEILVREARGQDGEGAALDARYITGRIILPMNDGMSKITSVQEIEGKKPPMWNEKVGEEYFARVRDKALDKAKAIISRTMAESERIKRQAFDEGYAAGQEAARQEAARQRQDLADELTQTLEAVRIAGRQAFDRQAQDITQLIRMAVERTLAVEMDQRREEIMASLLGEALDLIDSHRNLAILVRPGERELLRPLLEAARERHPGLTDWNVRESADVEPGGLWIESDDGIVDNTLNGRWASVDAILAQLSLEPEG